MSRLMAPLPAWMRRTVAWVLILALLPVAWLWGAALAVRERVAGRRRRVARLVAGSAWRRARRFSRDLRLMARDLAEDWAQEAH